MKTNPKNTLQLAFQQLEVFSIPGVGTFRRSYFPAHIDRETNVIRPPGERFILEKGERYLDKLEDFISRSIESGEEASGKVVEGVADIRTWLVRELKKGGKLIFPGVGSLELSKEKEVQFTAEENPASQRGNFFGLQPLAFSIGAEPAAVASKTKKEADTKKEEKAQPMAIAATPGTGSTANSGTQPNLEKKKEKAPEPVAVVTPPPTEEEPEFTDPGPPKKRSKAWIWIILILLLAGAGVSGIVWKDQVREQLVSWGWIDGAGSGGSGTIVDNGGDGSDGGENEGDGAVVDGDSTDMAVTGDDGSSDSEGDEDVNDDGSDTEENSVGDDTEIVGSFSEPGVYYLIVGSAKEASTAKVIRNEIKGKVLRPRYEGNYHRIYAYKSTDKDQVIAKMVESKEKYPNSWIYWMGM